MTCKSYCPAITGVEMWPLKLQRYGDFQVVCLVAGNRFLHFSSLNCRTFLLVVLKFMVFQFNLFDLINFFLISIVSCLVLHSIRFPDFGAFFGYFFMFNFH